MFWSRSILMGALLEREDGTASGREDGQKRGETVVPEGIKSTKALQKKQSPRAIRSAPINPGIPKNTIFFVVPQPWFSKGFHISKQHQQVIRSSIRWSTVAVLLLRTISGLTSSVGAGVVVPWPRNGSKGSVFLRESKDPLWSSRIWSEAKIW